MEGFTEAFGGMGLQAPVQMGMGGAGLLRRMPATPSAEGPIVFGQKRIAPTFQKYGGSQNDKIRGRLLTDVAEDLKAGRISPDELPIEYFIHNGQKVTVNNRGLAALTMAGKEPTVTRLVKSTNELMERLAEPAINRFHKMPGYRIPVTLNKDGSGHIYSVFIFRP